MKLTSWRRIRTSSLILGMVLAGLLGGVAACENGDDTPAQPAATSATDAPLVVNDAGAANPGLVETPLAIPAGFGPRDRAMKLPAGFTISLLATGLSQPRFMAFDGAGNLLVADSGDGSVYRYPANGAGSIDPAAQPPAPLLSGLDAPSNVALHDVDGVSYLYVGETSRVTRYRYAPDGLAGSQEVVVPDLPTSGHTTRTIAFGPDGKMYLAIGSSCNICTERDERRAAIQRYNPDGSGYERFARGMRNPVGIAFEPGSERLWATVNERDNQGNEIPPDLVTVVQQGADYGWPGCMPPDAAPRQDGADCSNVTPPTAGIQPHSAPLGLAFSTGTSFPGSYRGSLFVAQHGSWNREPPAAPKILQIEVENGRAVAIRDFATGWQDESGRRWGRTAGVVVAPDGSLIVSDDTSGVLYRISYGG